MRASGCASARASAHAGKRADSHVLSEVRASVRAVQVRVLVRRESVRACARACRATTGPDSSWCVERHHAARGRVGERKRVGGGCDGSCYANSTAMRRLVLRDQGAPKYCSENKNCVRVFFVAQVCVALRSVIAVAGKFASILICGLAA